MGYNTETWSLIPLVIGIGIILHWIVVKLI